MCSCPTWRPMDVFLGRVHLLRAGVMHPEQAGVMHPEQAGVMHLVQTGVEQHSAAGASVLQPLGPSGHTHGCELHQRLHHLNLP